MSSSSSSSSSLSLLTSTTYRRQQTWSNQHPVRKQKSFIETSSEIPVRGRETIIRRPQSDKGKLLYLHRQRSVVDQVRATLRCQSEQRSKGYSLGGGGSGSAGGVKTGGTYRFGGKDYSASKGVKLAWASDTFDGGDSVELLRHSSQAGFLVGSSKKNGLLGRNFMSDRLKKSTSFGASKPENKINLSIVLNQTIKATENEVVSSDIESSSESADTTRPAAPKQPDGKKSSPETATNKTLVQTDKRITSAAHRRAQFQASRGENLAPPTNPVVHTIPSHATPLSASPSLTIHPRPPLVRAMSAPVRSLDDNAKNILSQNKRKTRRRRIITRNASCDKGDNEQVIGKKVLSRSRSAISTDVITLVSLISSEGSDSEKEETVSAEETQPGRAPSLRKTGKSVSFQENEQPNFQTVVKDFPHLLRRGSIAPLAARLRSNRPPTAPPVSIFLADYENCSVKMSQHGKVTKDDLANSVTEKENNIFITNSSETSVDYEFPDYVRTLKERECWKLFQKMSKKGVTVSYDTVLRGMLTPTEFRLLQKQRDFVAAKAKEADERQENQILTEKK